MLHTAATDQFIGKCREAKSKAEISLRLCRSGELRLRTRTPPSAAETDVTGDYVSSLEMVVRNLAQLIDEYDTNAGP
jgi:hypothetical protein